MKFCQKCCRTGLNILNEKKDVSGIQKNQFGRLYYTESDDKEFDNIIKHA